MSEYHVPVMLKESVEGLNINPRGVYVDVTFGGGGHSSYILEQLTDGKLVAFDQDLEAQDNIPQNNKLVFVHGNFRFLRSFLRLNGFEQVDGILADLGVSSHHFDAEMRGFSFRFDGPLDMRMNTLSKLDAAHVVNTYEPAKLLEILRVYGEVDNPKPLVKAIVKRRDERPIELVQELVEALQPHIPANAQHKFLAKVFQALRIEVNREMDALKQMLEQSLKVLKPGGRLSVITYHSLEDRLVKNFMKSGNFEGKVEKDFYGNASSPFNVITRKALVPSAEELESNNRSRSAKLRIAEKK
jgi:16S rRNA (cytosine1402-N4)-methyltransferase